MDNLTGHSIRGYELKEQIGKGGFGAVYRAFQTSVNREVAVKVILPAYANQPDFIRRFETEAQLVAHLEHPFMVPLFDYWREPEGAYIVMRLLRGGSLRQAMDTRRFTPDDVLRLAEQVGGALAVAHRNSVVHRDLKPENVLLDEEGNAFLTDFGIAKVKRGNDDDNDDEGDEGGLTGSPGYMSPEQITQEPVTPQTDIYSFGIILYELLTGQHPFEQANVSELIVKHLQEPLPGLYLHDESLPEALNAVVQRATSKLPEDRYPDVLALTVDLRAAIQHSDVSVDTSEMVMVDLSALVNPYKGLRAFEESDAADFFGREALVAQLVGRMYEAHEYGRFLAVVGPSGSGKSSAVKAGMLPALRWGEVPGSESWFIAEMVPGIDPIQQLEAALIGVAYYAPRALDQQLRANERGLVHAVNGILPPDTEMLLVIDQFEEAFTLVKEEAERVRFLDLLRYAIIDPESRIRIIVTLRADFYDRPLLYEGFGTMMRSRTEVVLPLSAGELERAITGPAQRVGLEVDSDLVAALIADVREEPGALPLLQYVLTEVFERREGSRLTLAAYEASGGALGALARRADDLYNVMGQQQRAVTRQLFLRLVTLGEGAEDTRRRVAWAELHAITPDAEVLQGVLERFGRFRLLSFDRDAQTREPTIEVAHEALIREWQQLRTWLDESRADVRMQRTLSAAAAEWENSGQDSSFLLRGNRLAQYEEWVPQTDLALSAAEKGYFKASLAQREVLRAQEAERAARERELERQSQVRLRILVVVMSLAFVGALILSAVAFNQQQIAAVERDNARVAAITATVAQGQAQNEANRSLTQVAIAETAVKEADTQRDIAEFEALTSRSLALASNASQLEATGSTSLALALALEANLGLASPPDQAQRVLGRIAYAPGLIRRLDDGVALGHEAPVESVAFSPDGTRLLSASTDGGLILWDAETAQPLLLLQAHILPVTSVVFTPDGQGALSGSWDQSVILWDLQAGEPIQTFGGLGSDAGHRGRVSAVRVSTDGVRAVSGSTDGLIVWDLMAGELLRRIPQAGAVEALDISPDGQQALVGTEDNNVTLWDLNTGQPLGDFAGHLASVRAVAFSRDGKQALSASRDGAVLLWDLTEGRLAGRLESVDGMGHSLVINALRFTPDGRYAVTVSDDETAILWDLSLRVPLRTLGLEGEHAGPVNDVALHPSGGVAAVGVEDGSVLLWALRDSAVIWQQTAAAVGAESAVVQVAASADSTRLLAAMEEEGLLVCNTESCANPVPLPLPETDIADGVRLRSAVISPEGTRALSGDDQGRVLLWDLETGAVLRVLDGHTDEVRAVVFMPDGRRALSASDDTTLIMWDLETGEALRTLSGGHDRRVLSAAVSADGARALSGGADRLMVLWDLESGEVLHRFEGHARRVLSVAFSPDGRLGLSGSDDADIILWDLESSLEVRRFDVRSAGEPTAVTTVAFSPDGALAASAEESGAVTLWDPARGQPVRRFEVSNSIATSLSFVSDATLPSLVFSTRTGELLRVHAPSLVGLIEWVRANRYVPSLTPEQQRQYGILSAEASAVLDAD